MLEPLEIGKLFLVGSGGFIGSSLRYAVSSRIPKVQNIPAGTLIVNFLGSTMLAFLTFSSEPESLVYLVNVGMLGSFTTFSTFAYETFRLLEEGAYFSFGINISLNVAFCLGGVGVAYIALNACP